jgi:predicted phosphoribosyltransferase
MLRRFRDRAEAGSLLARELSSYAGRADVLVLGLARGGVPVAFEVAQRLGAPLDVFVVRKLGVPGREEFAMGAIASGGECVLDESLVRRLGIPPRAVEAAIAREGRELDRRERLYRGLRPPAEVQGRTVILVDDGLATGATMHAAVAAIRRRRPAAVVVAAPVAAPDTCAALLSVADDCVCVLRPRSLQAVGLWYEEFGQTEDAEVRALLDRGAKADASVA